MNEEYKCKDCKWLTGKKTIRGIECMNPKLQEKWNRAKNLWMGELRKDNARYKQASGLACKKFEAKEQTMSMISDLVDRLRAESKSMGEYGVDYMATLLMRAADTIEILSEKGKADRPQGEWIESFKSVETRRGAYLGTKFIHNGWSCSECSEVVEKRYPNCPYCLARMKGADDE